MKIVDLQVIPFRVTRRRFRNAIADPMDEEGYVHLPQEPGMGYRIVWDYIEDNRIGDAR